MPLFGGTLEGTPQDWQLTLAVNLTGVWNAMRAEIAHLLGARRRRHRESGFEPGPVRVRAPAIRRRQPARTHGTA